MRSNAEVEQLLKALDALEHPLVVFTPELEIVAANAFARRLHASDIIGKRCFEVFCQRDEPCPACSLPAAFAEEQPAAETGNSRTGQDRQLPCGRLYPVYDEERLEALVFTEWGGAVPEDIAAHLRRANAFLKNLIQSSPDAIIAADLEGRIHLFNDAAQKLFGYSSREINGAFNITDIFAQEQIDDVLARLRSDHYGGIGRLKAYHVIIRDKSQQETSIRLDAAIISEGGQELAVLAYLRDLRSGNRQPEDLPVRASGAVNKTGKQSLESIATSVAQHLKLYNQQFSETALGIGIIDREQLESARRHQEQLQAKTDVSVPLGRVLVQLGYISDEQRTAILAMQALAEDEETGGEGETLGEKARLLAKAQELYSQRFGDLTVRLGFISAGQLKRALEMQKQVIAKTKIDVPLGRVLEQLEYITEEQRAAVLAVQALAERDESGKSVANRGGPETTDAKSGEAAASSSKSQPDEAEPGTSASTIAVAEPTTVALGEADKESPADVAATALMPGEDGPLAVPPETDESQVQMPEEASSQQSQREADEPESESDSDGAGKQPENVENAVPEAGLSPDEASRGESAGEPAEPDKAASDSESRIRECFAVDISEDKLTARLILRAAEREGLVFDDLRDFIEAEGIRYGIIDEVEIRRFFEDESQELEPLIIARGYPPGEGKDPEVTYHFEIDHLQAGKLQEDGTIDWKDRGEIPQVEEGDLLAEIIPGVYGAVGMDVLGNEIPAEPIAKISLAAGKGVRKEGEGNRFVAGAKGAPGLSENNTLTVSPVLNIDGDLGIETGHVEFDGHIEVAGAIESGYQVRGTSLRAQSMGGAEAYISGDIAITGGIFESKIICQGNVRAVHVLKSNIEAGGDLVVDKEIIDSKVEVYGVCQLDYGTIVSSEIAARGGIIAQNVGTAMSKPSHLDVGVDHKLRRELAGLKKLYTRAERKKKEAAPRIKQLQAESDQINEALGEVAQKQDQLMVQSRQLQAKYDARETIDDTVKAEYEKAVAALEARRSQIDAQVEELMQKDGELEKAIEELGEQVDEIAQEQLELEERMETLRERRETEKGKPVVKVSGDLYTGNKISGPKSKITIEEDCRHVNIFETDKDDSGQFARWHMKIGPLR